MQQPSMLIVFMLVLARVGATLVTAPIFGEQAIPAQVKIGLSAIIAIILTPAQMSKVDPISTDPILFAILVGQQILIGLAFSLVFIAFFRAGEIAGELIGEQIGVTLAELRQGNEAMKTYGQLYNIVVGLIFLGIDGMHWVILGVNAGLDAMPITRVALTPQLVDSVMAVGTSAVKFGVLLALPLLATLLLADIITGLLGRAIPSLNLFVLGLPLKSALGLAVLMVGAPFTIAITIQILQQIPHLTIWR
jgi:flagellar biosynthetic protein FliR